MEFQQDRVYNKSLKVLHIAFFGIAVLLLLMLASGCATPWHSHKIQHTETRLAHDLDKWRGHHISTFIENSETPVTSAKKVGKIVIYQTAIKDNTAVNVGNVVFTLWYEMKLLCSPSGIIIDVDVAKRLKMIGVQP